LQLSAAPLSELAGESTASNWTEAAPILRRPARVWTPAMASDSRGRAHLVWEEDGKVLHALRQAPERAWSEPVQVAAGDSPSLTLDADDGLHVQLVNRFESQRQVYHLRWDGGAFAA
jgi:hypothetical protein